MYYIRLGRPLPPQINSGKIQAKFRTLPNVNEKTKTKQKCRSTECISTFPSSNMFSKSHFWYIASLKKHKTEFGGESWAVVQDGISPSPGPQQRIL